MRTLKQIWNAWRRPHGAVFLPVLPPLGAFIELAALLLAIALADALLPGLDVATLEPSPYWVPVLLLSLQYGSVAGLLAAGLAIALYAGGGLPEQLVEENHFTYLLRVWSLPILWIAVALVLGQFRLRQIEIKQRLNDKYQKSAAEAANLAQYAAALERRCQGLERQITSNSAPAGLAALGALERVSATPMDLAQALVLLSRDIFSGGRLSIFLVGPAGLEFLGSSHGEAETARPDVVDAQHLLFKAIVTEKKPVSALACADEEAALGSLGLAAVPLFHPETGRVIGMLKLDGAGASVASSKVCAHLAFVARFLASLAAEPRVVVDNTAPQPAGSRLTRGWRQYSWSAQSMEESAGRIGANEESGGRGSGRPRIVR